MTVQECPVFWATSTIKLLKTFGEEEKEGVAEGGGGRGRDRK